MLGASGLAKFEPEWSFAPSRSAALAVRVIGALEESRSRLNPNMLGARALRLILLQNRSEGLLERRGLFFFVVFVTFFQRMCFTSRVGLL